VVIAAFTLDLGAIDCACDEDKCAANEMIRKADAGCCDERRRTLWHEEPDK